MEELGVNALLCLAGGAATTGSSAVTTSAENAEFFEETTVHTLEVPAC